MSKLTDMLNYVNFDAMVNDPRWLNDPEMRAWKALAEVGSGLFEVINRDLKVQADLTLNDKDVLATLSDSPSRSRRVGELSDMLLTSRTRLSQRLNRLQERGLVIKQPSPEDGRVIEVALTDAGWELLVELAPKHVESVRTHVFDQLTDQDVKQLAESLEKLAKYLHASRRRPQSE